MSFVKGMFGGGGGGGGRGGCRPLLKLLLLPVDLLGVEKKEKVQTGTRRKGKNTR